MELTRREDFVLLLLWPIISASLSLHFSVSYIISIFLFLGFPSAYLSLRVWDKTEIEKITLFSVIVSVSGTLFVEYFAYINSLWVEQTMFSFRVFGFIPVESFFWAFFSIYLPVIFYEYFLHHHVVQHIVYPDLKKRAWILFSLSIFVSSLFVWTSFKLHIPYAYLVGGLFFTGSPILFEFLEKPEALKRIAEAGAYFALLTFSYEIVALKLGLWSFGTEVSYIGWINLAGESFPIEEAFFWFLLFSMTVIVVYDRWDEPDFSDQAS